MELIGWLLLDGLTVLVFALCIYAGIKQGFVQAVLRLLGSILSLVGSVLLSKWIADWFYEAALRNGIYSYLSDKLPAENFTAEGLGAFLAEIPDSLLNLLQATLQFDLTASLNEAFQNGRSTLLTFLTEEVAGPVMLFLVTVILFLVLLILLGLLTRYLTGLFRFVNALPLIGPVNAVLGGAAGVLRGLTILLAVAVFVDILCSVTDNAWAILNPDVIRRTFLYYPLVKFNPIGGFLF